MASRDEAFALAALQIDTLGANAQRDALGVLSQDPATVWALLVATDPPAGISSTSSLRALFGVLFAGRPAFANVEELLAALADWSPQACGAGTDADGRRQVAKFFDPILYPELGAERVQEAPPAVQALVAWADGALSRLEASAELDIAPGKRGAANAAEGGKRQA